MEKARLKKLYDETIAQQLFSELGLTNVMEIPKLSKIVLNVGSKEAVADSRILQEIDAGLGAITGQQAARTLARKSIAAFKLRKDMPIGMKVTLRRERMYEFLDRLINISLPKTRDFQGVPLKLDGRGNYNLGIKEWSIFPEMEKATAAKVFGLNVTIETTAKTDEHGRALLRKFGMPFRKG